MKRNRNILKIVTYSFYIIITFVILIFILYYSKNKEVKFILSSIGIWFCFFLFCVYKICKARKYVGFFEKGIYDAVDFDDMDGFEFEELTCDILVANGFEIAESTQNSGDFGVDVIAQRDGIIYAIQCKRYNGPVGIDAVQQVYASALSWDEWAKAHGIKVVNVPVGFKEIANIMKKVELQIKNNPEGEVVVDDVFGNSINLGVQPRLIFGGEESGGMIMGSVEVWDHNQNVVEERHPALKKEAGVRCCWARFFVLDKLMLLETMDAEKKALAKRLAKELKKHPLLVLEGDHFTNGRKIAYLTLFLGTGIYRQCVRALFRKRNL